MLKWYEDPKADYGIIISSRVRLARNLADFNFPTAMSGADAAEAIRLLRKSIFNEENRPNVEEAGYNFVDLPKLSNWDLNILSERHVISPSMVSQNTQRGLVHNASENISIMFNEEDHVRIQTIFVGKNLGAAYAVANLIDDTMSKSLDFAFDADFGYLTSCPSNTGTGLRASYMLHLPLLEVSGNLANEIGVLTRAGLVIRGLRGEGSEPLGSIYQVSNQRTLGRSEEQIIADLEHYASQLVEKESALKGTMATDYLIEGNDSFWRSYGILSHCRKISLPEALRHLSEIRLGQILGPKYGMGENPANTSIYNLMTNVQPYSLQKIMGTATDARHLDILRADYLRQAFGGG
ncbi:MAG: ATP--guanido phosphotransferase [Defluviitaleaceae bacterium]|nr:ATP--guanido phosphotransferase [Defluviitaleaceae bacterium]